ncbi:MAG: hypothetical protein Q7T86_03360 [Hyphomicrobiaceae bacterium]|nr:hypothetical protein [Hyphomicrobiaceae bacterium]
MDKAAGSGWMPEDVEALAIAIRRVETRLPGWWWRVGACHVSADATLAPDSKGPDAHLAEYGNNFDGGFDCDLAQPATCAQALNQCIDMALAAKEALNV